MTQSFEQVNDFPDLTPATPGEADDGRSAPPRCKLGWRNDRPVILCASPEDRDRAIAALEDITVEVQAPLDGPHDQDEANPESGEEYPGI